MDNRAKGNYGEMLAAKLLQEKGYGIRETNFRNRTGEIDLIVEKDGVIVFVEVKYRRNISRGYPREAVNAAKQRNVRKLAEYYIYAKEIQNYDFRFDVIEIIDSGQAVIEHIENAF